MMDTMGWAIMKMVMALGILCTVLYVLARLLKRSGMVKNNIPSDSGIRPLTTRLIAPQKYISLVEIGGEVLALGISEAQITLLTKIENKEFLEKIINAHQPRPDPLSLFHYFPLKNKGFKTGLLRRFYGR